jgi:N-acylneuraminate cytidylyltransferase
MDVLAIIPARGGSKRVPRKNLLPLAGRPLIAHSVEQACAATRVHSVVVSTDDDEIAKVARECGAEVSIRPPALATDRATSESALLHVLDERADRGLPDPDLVVFLQCTSPVRRAGDIDGAVDHLLDRGADSLLSACENTRFLWGIDASGQPFPYNYDFRKRCREQDLEPQFQENGSIYVFRPWVLRELGNRLGGRMAIYEMDYWSSFQIDTPDDVALIEWILEVQR